MVTIDQKSVDEAFKQFLIKVSKNKTYAWDPKLEEDQNDLALLTGIIEHYAEYGDRTSYDKIVKLLNLFIDPNLEKSLDKNMSRDAFLEMIGHNTRYSAQFPLLKTIRDITASYQTHEEKALEAFQKLKAFLVEENGLALSFKEREMLNPADDKHHIHGYPQGAVLEDLTTLPYQEMITEICNKAIKEKMKQDPNFKWDAEKEKQVEILKDNLMREHYKAQSLKGLDHLVDFYHDLDFKHLWNIPHLVYFHYGRVLFYPDTSLNDMLPHPLFKTLLPLRYKFKYLDRRSYPMTYLMANLITETQMDYRGWSVEPKTSGSDPGFTLRSPDETQTLYVKHTSNMFQEYFVAKLLAQLGIKMAEPTLLIDELGNIFFATQNLSRRYTKAGQPKSKTFMPMADAINAPTMAFGFTRIPNDPSLPEQALDLKIFMDSYFNSKASRVSYAKLLIVAKAFGLGDLLGQGGNVGALISRSTKKERVVKLGLVDFKFHPKPLEVADSGSVMPIFITLGQQLKEEDIRQAALEIAHLKERELTASGIMIQKSPERTLAFSEVIDKVASQVKDELQKVMPQAEFDSFCKELDKNKDIMIKNMEALIKQLIPSPEATPSQAEQLPKAEPQAPKRKPSS